MCLTLDTGLFASLISTILRKFLSQVGLGTLFTPRYCEMGKVYSRCSTSTEVRSRRALAKIVHAETSSSAASSNSLPDLQIQIQTHFMLLQ